MRYVAILLLLLAAPAAAEEAPPPSSATAYNIVSGSSASYHAFTKTFFIIPGSIDAYTESVSGSVGIDTAVNGIVTISAGSLSSGDDTRDGQMREMLQTNKFPAIHFSIEAVTPLTPGDVASYTGAKTVRGGLTVRGVTKEVSFPATIRMEGPFMAIEGAVEVKYTDFGMEPPAFWGILKRAEDRIILKAHLLTLPFN